ncbi:MAG: T9SS type A sorting domain-containing protein [Fluviicola sp.]|nr:T9SS type A sorting domain-containing protein [Fluviicola sp.]
MKKIYILKILFLAISINCYSQFGSPIPIDNNLTASIRNIITFDINNDGLKDVVVSEYTNNIRWYENTGSGFNTPQNISTTFSTPYHLDKADVNGDGFIDLLVTNNNGNTSGASVFLNNNGGVSWTEVVISNTLAIGGFKSFFLDIENDGDQDIVINSDTKITLYLNDGNGVFSSEILMESMDEYYSMTVGDFTNDGFTDLVLNTATFGMVIYTNNMLGSFNSPVNISNGLRIFLTSADIDNDNAIDVISGNPNNNSEVQFYKNDGTGLFTFNHNEPNSDALDVTNAKFNLTDLNNDTFIDILYIDNNEIFWKENNQTSSFINTSSIDNSLSYRVVYSDDIDNDGDNDIIWSGFDSSNNTIKLGYILNETILSITDEVLKNVIVAYPNPTSSILYISNIEMSKEAFLYNAIGQIITSTKSNAIDLSILDNGIYFLKVELKNKEQETIKIIKQ